MSRYGYVMDLVARSFFVFVVAMLMVRTWWLAGLISLVINLVYELTAGRKYWRQLKNAPKKPRRRPKEILGIMWQRLRDRRRTKGLVVAGIVVLLMSWLVPMPVYYLVVAGVIFTLAAISRFAPPDTPVNSSQPSQQEKYPLQ